MENTKDLNFYLEQPYTLIIKEIKEEEGNYFYGKYLELDGCQSTGDTIEELQENLKIALKGYLLIKLEMNINIPLPIKEDDFSGKFVVRMPKSLHLRLSIEAEKEGVSLNQYAMYKLAK